MSKISIKGVLIGAITNEVGGMTFYVLVSLLLILPASLDGSLATKGWIDILMTMAYPAFALLGGFVAARIAKRNEMINGALSSFIGVALCVLTLVRGQSGNPSFQMALIVILPLFGFLGGLLEFGLFSRGRKTNEAAIDLPISAVVSTANTTTFTTPITTAVVTGIVDDEEAWLHYLAHRDSSSRNPGTTVKDEYDQFMAAHAKNRPTVS
jgi:putative membrane protein (TIGR04086 family)